MRRFKFTASLLIVLLANVSWAGSISAPAGFETWLVQQKSVSSDRLLANVSPAGTLPGSVIASPSRTNPDYYYNWVRDGALVMTAVKQLNLGGAANARHMMLDYLAASKIHQDRSGASGLGEPKYFVDGQPYTLPWGRPQNDGPALRSIVLISLAVDLLREGQESLVRKLIFDGGAPQSISQGVVIRDLDFLVTEWRNSSFDLWEEVQGDHFYTMSVQQRALLDGGDLAETLGDLTRANIYRQAASEIRTAIEAFKDQSLGILVATRNRVGGHQEKTSGLDVAVLLGVLHSNSEIGWFSASNEWVIGTLDALTQSFSRSYAINANGTAGVAFGRYPEDQYYGGNPWFLTTAAEAEIYYRMVTELVATGQFRITSRSERFFHGLMGTASHPAPDSSLGSTLGSGKDLVLKVGQKGFNDLVRALFRRGEQSMARIKFHVPQDLSLSEQFDRTSGYCTSAVDLTWSYASFLTAAHARENALKVVP